jgi:hypothetical protein
VSRPDVNFPIQRCYVAYETALSRLVRTPHAPRLRSAACSSDRCAFEHHANDAYHASFTTSSAIHRVHRAANDEQFIREVTSLAVEAESERLRIEVLTLLDGVAHRFSLASFWPFARLSSFGCSCLMVLKHSRSERGL